MNAQYALSLVFATVISVASAARNGEIRGNVYEIDVPSGQTVDLSPDDVAALGTGTGDITELKKSGDGTLVVATALPNFAGTIRVVGGTYQVKSTVSSPFGTTAGPTIVDGGTVRFVGNNGSATALDGNFQTEEFQVAGQGYAGEGAICIAAENTPNNNKVRFGKFKLLGDVLITGEGAKNKNFPYFVKDYTFDMGGYTMTLDSSGNAQFDSNQIVNPGHFVTRGAGQFYIASSALFNHGPEHTITVGSTAYLSFYRNSLSNPFNWKVICAATTSTISFEMASTFAGEIMFDGDIEINSGCTCKFSVTPTATPFKLTGDISGEGDLSIGGSQVYLAGDNSYLGMTKGGYVYVASPTAIPDNSSSKLTSGINGFVFSSTDDGVGIKSDQVADFANGIWKATLEGTADKNFYVDEGGVVELDVDISDWKGSFYNKSNGTIAFTHTIASEQSLSFYHTGTMGGFRFSNPQGETSSIGSWTLNEGRLELFNTDLFKSNNTIYCSAPSGKSTCLVISNSHVWGGHFKNTTKQYGPFVLGGGGGRDTLEILSGSGVTNSLFLGRAANSVSALYHRGGSFGIEKNYQGTCAIGEYGTGYLETSGGNASVNLDCQLGYKPGSTGLHYMSGGAFEIVKAPYNIGQSGNAVYYQTGGALTSSSTSSKFYVGSCDWDTECAKASAQGLKHVFTLEGVETTASFGNGIVMSERNNTEDTININDGAKLTAYYIHRSRADCSDGKNRCLPPGGFYTNDNAYINFNGGTFKSSSDSDFFGADETWDGRGTTSRRPRVTIYPKGATIETTRYGGLSASLQAPAGLGVTEVPMPENAVTSGLNAPPYVNIKGDGTNATAVALFDSKTQTWTGIKITSPGFGYTWAKAEIGGGLYEVDCAIGDVSGGGVHFIVAKGSELKLKGQSTYTGPTRISCGRVWFDGGSIASRDIAIDVDANIVMAEFLNGANVHGSGTVYGSWNTAAFTADGNEVGVVLGPGTTTINENPVFTIKNWSGSDQVITVLRKGSGAIVGTANLANATFVGETIPENFNVRARYVDNAIVVKITERKGLIMIVR